MLLIDFIKCIMNVFKHEGFDVSLPRCMGICELWKTAIFSTEYLDLIFEEKQP